MAKAVDKTFAVHVIQQGPIDNAERLVYEDLSE